MKRALFPLLLIIALFVACPPGRPTHLVNVCQVSGQLAGQYCPPETVRAVRYYENPMDGEPHPPVVVCTIHHEPPPPYVPPIADTTAPRTGVEAYQVIVFPLDQIKTYLDDLVKNGGSVLRIFFCYTWGDGEGLAGWQWSPFKQVGWWIDSGGQYDGRKFPLFTIADSEEYGSPWVAAVWEKWAAIFKLCAERKIMITVSVLDGCSMNTGYAARLNPMLSTYQHLGAEGPGTADYERLDGSIGQGLGIHTGGILGGFGADHGAMKSYLPALISRVVAFLNASGVEYRVMPANEFQAPITEYADQATQDALLKEYLTFWIEQLKGLGLPNDKIVLSIAGTHDRTRVTVPLRDQYPGVIEQMHGPNSDVTLQKFIDRYGMDGIEYDGDGFDNAAEGYANEYNYKMPSVTPQCPNIRVILIKYKIKRFAIFQGYIEGPDWQDLTAAKWAEQRALAGKD
jgi:hypothetical protein